MCAESPQSTLNSNSVKRTLHIFLLQRATGFAGAVCGILLVLLGNSVSPAAPSGAASAEAEVRATRLDGTTLSGELVSWLEREVVLRTAEGEERIPTEALVSLRWSKPPAGQSESSTVGIVELADGTIVPTTDYVTNGKNATLTLDSPPATNERQVSVSLRQIAAVRLRALEPPAARQWDEIRRQNIPSDVVVVLQRDGKSLDYVDGVLGEITRDKIGFKYDDQSLTVDRAKVAGLVYYRRSPAESAEPRCVLHGHTGLVARAASVRLAGGVVQITTVGGVSLQWPLSDVQLADFSSGKIVYLSDIEPAAEEWTPLVALPAAAEFAAGLGKPRRDRSAYGGPLSLTIQENDAPSSLRELRAFEKGLAIRSRTELVYRLPANFRRFVAVAGIEPATSAVGNVRIVINADDKLLFDAEIRGDQPPHDLDFDIAGVKRLRIVVDFGQNLDTGDWLNLCDARLVK